MDNENTEVFEVPEKVVNPYKKLVDDVFKKSPSGFNKEFAAYLETFNVNQKVDVAATQISAKIKELCVKHSVAKGDTLIEVYQNFLHKNNNADGFYLIHLLVQLNNDKE